MSEFDAVNKKLDRLVASARSKSAMKRLAEGVAEQIRKRTRLGYGVDRSGAKQTKLKPLKSEKYIRRRQIARKGGELSGNTSPKRSNLTFTGQLLDAIKGKALRAGESVVYVDENRDDGVLNSDIIDGQENIQGRPFYHISKTEYTNIVRGIRTVLRKQIDSLFGK